MNDREQRIAQALASYPQWPNLAPYVADGHSVSEALELAMTDLCPQTLIQALSELDREIDAHHPCIGRVMQRLSRVREVVSQVKAHSRIDGSFWS